MRTGKTNSRWPAFVLTIAVAQLLTFPALAMAESPPDFVVYKNAQCGCCDKWAEHMRGAGYSVALAPQTNMSSIKQKYGIEPRLQSCHTAVHLDTGLVFEGHIPAQHIAGLIDNHAPEDAGLAVPGMPAGSPGMEVGSRRDPYDILLLSKDGAPKPFAHVEGNR